jgi:hypothetical protein
MLLTQKVGWKGATIKRSGANIARKKTFPRLTKFSTFMATSLLPVAPPE